MENQNNLVEINVCAPPELTDPIASFMIDKKSGGVIIEDIEDSDNQDDRKKMGWQWIRAYFPPERVEELRQNFQTYLGELHELAKNSEPPFFDLRLSQLKNWEQAWKAFFKPVELCECIVVKPTWETVSKTQSQIIELDPGMAFGTGGHPTTKLSAQGIKMVLGGFEEIGKGLGVFSALDVGCGSGILSLVAAKLGIPRVVGIDIDPVATEVARANVALNKMGRKVIIRDELLEDVFETFDIVIANIIAQTLIEKKLALVERCNVGGYLILSGILRNQGSAVKASFLKTNLEFVTTLHDDQWCALVLRKI